MSQDDGIGYKRPPKEHRFGPGASGNPRGRPRGTRNLRSDLAQLMKKTVAVRENGKHRRISRQEAMLLSLYDKALHGDVKAATSLVNMVLKLDPSAGENIKDEDLADSDTAIVEDFLRRNQAASK
jgi:hypothetical protein